MIYTPLAWLFRCTGVSPSGTRWDKYICLATLFVNVPMCAFAVATVPRDLDTVVYTTTVACYITAFLGAISLVIFNFFCRRSYQTILSDMKTVEEELRRVDAPPSPTAHHQPLVLYSCVCLFVSLVICQAVEGTLMIHILRIGLCNVTLNIGLIQHLVLVRLLHSLFFALNLQLERFSTTADDTPVHVMSSQLEYVFRLHTYLHKTVTDVNGHFFVYNLMLITFKVIFCVSFMYNYLLSVSDKTVHIKPSRTYLFLMQTLFLIVQCDFCHACSKEANRTVLLAHYTLQPHTPYRLWKEVGDFSYLCIDNKVNFTLGEMFNLDRPLITKIAVTAFSYLVVIVQLKDVELFGEGMTQYDSNVTTLKFFNATVESKIGT